MTKEPASPDDSDQSTARQWKLIYVVALGLGSSLLALALASWFFAYQATIGEPAWVWVPPLSQEEMFLVIRNAITFIAALGVGVTLFLSYRKQRVSEQQLTVALQANMNAIKALELTGDQHKTDYEDKLRARYSTAAQQIGDTNASLAAAGIISMAAVADEWQKLKRTSDRDDCIRMIVAGLPGENRVKNEATIIQSTCRSIFDRRMKAVVPDTAEWWGAGIDFTTTSSVFGPIYNWVINASRVRIRANQLSVDGTSIVQGVNIDGGILEISMQDDEEHLVIQNATIEKGGIDLKFGRPTPNKEVTAIFNSLKSHGGRVKFEETDQTLLKRFLIFKDCEFVAPGIALPSHCAEYEIVFDRCSFLTSPFFHLNAMRGEKPRIRLEGRNDFTDLMTGFPQESPQELLNVNSKYYSPDETEELTSQVL